MLVTAFVLFEFSWMKGKFCLEQHKHTNVYLSSKVVVLTHKSPCADSEFWSMVVPKVVNQVLSVHLHACLHVFAI